MTNRLNNTAAGAETLMAYTITVWNPKRSIHSHLLIVPPGIINSTARRAVFL
jgi:hypothetical protein